MKFCKKCLLPETYPGIEFDDDGVCSVCRAYEKKWKNFNFELAEIECERKIKNAESQYGTVVVTCSGGLDSSYAILLMRKKFDSNVVGANFDHGFVSDTAKKNLNKISKILNVPIITIKPDFDVMYRLYRDFLIKTGDFCTPCCQGCSRSGFLVARQNNTKTIVHGGVSGSRVEFNVLGMLKHHYERFMRYTDNNYTPDELYNIVTPTDEIKKFELISLPQCFEWNENKIIDTLRRELDWEFLPDGRTRHIDCLIADVSDFLLQKKFGFSKKWMTISANIRAGIIDIEQGRESIKQTEEKLLDEPKDAMDLFLSKIEYTRKELYNLPFYIAEPAVKYL
ncbi:hypothetical protein J7L68_06210 [bacterium]|nr:hypothetical protein [bacterium]